MFQPSSVKSAAVSVLLTIATLVGCSYKENPAPVGVDDSVADGRKPNVIIMERRSNETRPQMVLFKLKLPNEPAALRARDRAVTQGFSVGLERVIFGTGWELLASKDLYLDVREIERESARLTKIAEAEGGQYTGWDTDAR